MTTLAALRAYAAREAGPFHVSTATSGTTGSLVDTASPVFSSIDQADLYRDKWLWRPAASAGDRLRVIKEFDSALGQFTPDKIWGSAPTTDAYEVHGVVDPSQWAALLNEGLKRIGVVDELTITPTAGATRHSLATHAFLTKEWQIRQVGWLSTGETRANQNPFRRLVRGTVMRDGDALFIEHPQKTFLSTDTIYINTVRLAYDFCKPSAGVYGAQSGLALDTDEAVPPEDLVAFATLDIIARRAFAPIHPDERPLIAENQARWQQMFQDRHGEFFQPPPLTFFGRDVREYHTPRDPWDYARPREALSPSLSSVPPPSARFPALGQPRPEMWTPRPGLDEDANAALLAQLTGNGGRRG